MSDGIQWGQKNVQSGLVAAIAIGVIFTIVVLEFVGSEQEHKYNRICSQTTYEQSFPTFIPTPESTKADHNQAEWRQKYFDNQIACSDLRAQWRVATMTRRAYYLGFLGIFLIFVTWLATKQAANSASETLGVAERASRRELQAYLTISCEASVGNVDGEGLACHVWVQANNIGNTPAQNVTITCRAFVATDNNARAGDLNDPVIVGGYLEQKSVQGAIKHIVIEGAIPTITNDGSITVAGEPQFIIDGFVEFDDIYTVSDKSLPRRRVYIHRYGRTSGLWHLAGGERNEVQMIANHEYESAT